MNESGLSKIPVVTEHILIQLENRMLGSSVKQNEELLSLHSVFGAVLQRALNILERFPTLVVYTTQNKTRTLIAIPGESDRCYKIFPKVNFCTCQAFKHQVIGRKSQERNMDEGTSQYYFTACMESGKTLCSLLKAIQFQESAVFCALPEGLKLTVEEGKCVQASAYVPSDNFTEYHVRSDVDVMFKISIAVLAECLNIFGSGEESSLKMYYRGEGSPLLLVLQPLSVSDVMTDCEIATQTADSLLELRDEDTTEVAKLVLKAPAFLGLLADLERSCDVIELNLSPDHPNISFVTYGMQDRSCIDMPKTSDMVQSFSCEQPVTLKYQLHHIRLIMKALGISTKVVLRCSSNGVLLLQLKLEKEDQRQMFSEFYIVPLLDD